MPSEQSQETGSVPEIQGGVTMLHSEAFVTSEADDAKVYWSGRAFDYYKQNRPWTDFMADEILAFHPESVFEFGCNAGKNLLGLKQRHPDLFVAGADINRAAVNFGRTENGLSLLCGDETVFDIIPDKTYDVVFTVSVLDHVPEPAKILRSFARTAAKAVLLLEPFTGEEGKVVKNIDRRSGKWIDTTPFSYSWDYLRLVEDNLPGWKVESQDFPMDSNLGRFYKYYKIVRTDAQQPA